MATRISIPMTWVALIALATGPSTIIAQSGKGDIAKVLLTQGPPQQGGGFPGGPGGQGGPGGPRGMRQMGPPTGPELLLNPQVIKELKETDAQVKAIQELLRKNRRGPGGPGGQGGPGGPPPGGPGQGGGNFGGGEEMAPEQGGGYQGGPPQGGQGGPGGPGNQAEVKKMEEAIKNILTPGQYKRYREINLQVEGPRAFMRPELGDALNLSEDQRDQIREIMESNRPPQGGPGGPPPGGPGQGGQQGGGQQGGGQRGPGGPGGDPGKFADALMDKIKAVLTEAQKAKYKEMTGAAFKLERPQGGPQGGPGGPPPGGPGQGGFPPQRGGGNFGGGN